MKLGSFDVFDTLLSRAVAEPVAVFLLLGRRLNRRGLIGISAEAFARARIDAELRGRRNCDSGEVTLEVLYTELALALNLTEELQRTVLQEELVIEAELMRPVPGAAERVVAAREAHDRIAFVSDMYLPADFVRKQLQRHGFFREGDLLYLSCEEGCGKWNGRLYRRMLREQRLRGRDVVHQGNNRRSDVRRARLAGVRAIYLPQANINRYEQALATHLWSTEGLSAAMAGASRLARLSVPASSPREEVLRDVGAGVAGPILCSFVLWTLGMAKRLGLKRLYFLARDGQILYHIACVLKPKVSVDCELRYLYCSRQACHQPSITELGTRELGWVFDGATLPTVRRALSRLSLTPEELSSELEGFGISKDQWENPAPSALGDMIQSEPVRGRALQRAALKREALTAYLKQEGLCTGEPYALVDTGWLGRLQDSIARVLAMSNAPPPLGLYFGLNKRDNNPAAGAQCAYFFDGQFQTGYSEIALDIPVMAEMFCLADHGMTVGYQNTPEGSITPILKKTANSSAWEWGGATVREAVMAFAQQLYLNPDDVNPHADMREALSNVITAFWRNPSRQEAVAWGAFPYEDDQSGDLAVKVASRYGLTDICSAFIRGSRPRPHAAGWASGSWRLSALPMRSAVSASALLGRRARRAVPQQLQDDVTARARLMYRNGLFDRLPRLKAFLHVLSS